VIDHGSMGVGTEMLAKSAVVDERTTTILTLDHSFKTRSFKFNHHKSSMRKQVDSYQYHGQKDAIAITRRGRMKK
jgi:hypothetical protein